MGSLLGRRESNPGEWEHNGKLAGGLGPLDSAMAEIEKGHLLAVAVGNPRRRLGISHGNELEARASLPNSDMPALTAAVLKAAESEHGVSIVIASVTPPVTDALQRALVD